MAKKKHTLIKLAGLAALPLAYYGTGSVIFDKMFKIDKGYIERDIFDFLPDDFTKEAYSNSLDLNIDWYKSSKLKKASITSFDGLLLDGIEIINHNSNNFVILVHGYNTDRYVLLEQARIFAELGYNSLLIDQRGWGNSEGDYTTFGFKESLDLLKWIDYLIKEYPDVNLGLYGVSMGASTVLLTSGHSLPNNVSFAISDCAYTSLEDLLTTKLNTSMLNASIKTQVLRKLGFKIEEVNCLKMVSKSNIPTLFIHGDNDKLLPYQMTLNLHAALNTKKMLCIINGSDHAYNCYRNEFKEAIIDFLDNLESYSNE